MARSAMAAVVLLAFSGLPSILAQNCPTGTLKQLLCSSAHGQWCYVLQQSSLSFGAARSKCGSLGGDLFTPSSPAEDFTVSAYFRGQGSLPNKYWMGVFKPGNDKLYKRTDLRPVQQARPSADASDYANWFKGFALRADSGNTKTCVAAATGSAYSSYNGGAVDNDGSYSRGGQARPGWVNEECSAGQPVICRLPASSSCIKRVQTSAAAKSAGCPMGGCGGTPTPTPSPEPTPEPHPEPVPEPEPHPDPAVPCDSPSPSPSPSPKPCAPPPKPKACPPPPKPKACPPPKPVPSPCAPPHPKAPCKPPAARPSPKPKACPPPQAPEHPAQPAHPVDPTPEEGCTTPPPVACAPPTGGPTGHKGGAKPGASAASAKGAIGTCSSQLLESKALSSTGPNCLASPDGTRALVLSVSGSLTLQNLATGANMWAVAADAGRGATAPFSLTMRASGRIMLVDANNNMIFQSAAPSGGNGPFKLAFDGNKLCVKNGAGACAWSPAQASAAAPATTPSPKPLASSNAGSCTKQRGELCGGIAACGKDSECAKKCCASGLTCRRKTDMQWSCRA